MIHPELTQRGLLSAERSLSSVSSYLLLNRISTDASVGSQPASDNNDQDGRMTFVVVVVDCQSEIHAEHG